jgi:tripartite-type tricarboxylate transporter receptor subunit TctC
MGLPSIVENKPGATGTLGAEYVYRSNPDGLNLLVATSDTISIFPQLSKTRFEADRFVPIAGMGGIPLYLVGRPDLPARNLTELATLARKQNMSYANAGTGGALHMAAVAFGKAVNAVEMMHVPFQGAVPAMQSILGKQVDLCMTTGSLALQQRGRVIIFGGSGAKRLAGLADAPTFIEQGLPLEIVSWSGLLAAPETRPELAADIAKTMGEIIASAPYQTKLAELMMSSYAMSHPEFAKFLTGEHRKWADLVRASNVKLD